MTNYKSDLTQLLIEVEEFVEKADNGDYTKDEIVDYLNSMYDKLNDIRWSTEEYISGLVQDLESVTEQRFNMED